MSVKTVSYFHTILPTSFGHLLTRIWFFKKNQQYQGWNDCIHQQTLHLKPPWICSIGACSWCRRNSQNKKFSKICSEGHPWQWLKEVGSSYLPSFVSMHSYMTSKSSLMKQYCVLDSESGSSVQNCSVASDSLVRRRAEWVKVYAYDLCILILTFVIAQSSCHLQHRPTSQPYFQSQLAWWPHLVKADTALSVLFVVHCFRWCLRRCTSHLLLTFVWLTSPVKNLCVLCPY